MVDGTIPHESSLRTSHDDFIDKDRLSHRASETNRELVREIYFTPNEFNLRTVFHSRLSEGRTFTEEELFGLIHSVSRVNLGDPGIKLFEVETYSPQQFVHGLDFLFSWQLPFDPSFVHGQTSQ